MSDSDSETAAQDPAHEAGQSPAPKAPRPKGYQSSLPGVLGTVDVGISRLESFLLAAGVLLMGANVVANVVGRFILGASIQFTGELNRALIIMITFAGISYAARHGRHIRMSAIYDALPPKARKVLMIVICLTTAVFMFGLAWYSFQYIITQYGRGRVLSSLQLPVWLILVWVPIGFFMTGLQYALTAIKNIIENDIYLSTNVLEGYSDDESEV